jgi:CTP synthase (UTP-ammonia lyase)
MNRVKIALVGERDDAIVAHRGIARSLALAGEVAGEAASLDVEPTWVRTDAIREAPRDLEGYSGVWCVPGSPYASMAGALAAIRFARERRVPFLGTCGGFQHALVEYARDVLGAADAEHAETAGDTRSAIIVPLECALLGVAATVTLESGSRLARAYGADEAREEYQCRYGLDEAWRARLAGGGLVFTAFDAEGHVRGAEIPSHPFFVATLFQPERRALHGELPPVVAAFVNAARQHAAG